MSRLQHERQGLYSKYLPDAVIADLKHLLDNPQENGEIDYDAEEAVIQKWKDKGIIISSHQKGELGGWCVRTPELPNMVFVIYISIYNDLSYDILYESEFEEVD